jgi:hypothetical protein
MNILVVESKAKCKTLLKALGSFHRAVDQPLASAPGHARPVVSSVIEVKRVGSRVAQNVGMQCTHADIAC